MLTLSTPIRQRLTLRPFLLLLPFALPFAADSSAIDFDDRFVHPMFHDPELVPPSYQIVFYDNLRPVWFTALADDDPELRRLAADTIAIAHHKGMRGLEEAESELLRLLQREDSDPRMRLAAARAIVELDAKKAADVLTRYLPSADLQYAQVVEPALARWGYEPMVEQWLARLSEPATGRVRLFLALECLAAVQEEAARDRLIEIVLDPNALTTVRLAAARAASDIDRASLLEASAALLNREALVDRLVGTTLLRGHSSEPAIALLQRAAADPVPPIAGLALRILFNLDPQLIFAHAAQAVQHSDVNIRRVAAEALVVQGDAAAVELLATLLDDPNRKLRRYVSDRLIGLAASDELRKTVIGETRKIADSDRWRGLEQAIRVLGGLDDEPSADRMVELLHHSRPEVGYAAAWALQEIAVADVLPQMLQYANDNGPDVLAGRHAHEGIARQVAQLFQAFGRQRYEAAEPLLRKFVPKAPNAPTSRGAAIWAVGFMNEGQAPPDLTSQLEQRLADVNPLLPEYDVVRSMAAISLGRMGATSALPTLRKFSDEADGVSDPALACIWAIEHLTDEEFPKAAPFKLADTNWFLAPIQLAEPIERSEPNVRASQ